MARPLRLLFFDIETSAQVVYRWPNQEWVPHKQVVHDWFIHCWAAKWSDQKQILSSKQTREEVLDKDDSRIAGELADLVRQADMVCAHNGDRFDIKKLNARLAASGLEPIAMPVKSIDTLKLVKRDFGLAHNNLEAVAKFFGLGTKMDTNFDLWASVYEGDEMAMQRMLRYCKRDVELLEQVFEHLRPYVRLPRMVDGPGSHCPYCGSPDYEKRGKRYTNAGTSQRYRCLSCGKYFHDKTTDAGQSQMRPG